MADPLAEGTTETEVETTTPAGPSEASVADTTPVERTTPAPSTETFFDPQGLSEELLPAYKQMQAEFTRKNQSFRDGRQKMEAYDAFMANPAASIQEMAQQYGVNLQGEQPSEEWQPNTWDEVLTRAKEETRQEVLRELQPYLGQMRNLQRDSIETSLDKAVPEWRQYEDEISATLQAHPTLANDPVKLAKLSLPDNVLESRATQAALKKLQAKQSASEVTGGSTSPKMPNKGDLPKGKMSFAEAVKWARNKLEAEGNLYIKST